MGNVHEGNLRIYTVKEEELISFIQIGDEKELSYGFPEVLAPS
jgi:hypothetical protein